MSNLVILDSQIFIWAIKLEDNENQKLDVQRARTLIKIIEHRKDKIVVPTPQLAELLSGCNTEKRQELMSLISRRYQILPFDNLAAMKFGELLKKTLSDADLRAYFKSKDIYKARMKFDCMIVAIGITRGIKCLYTHDSDLKRYADLQIPIQNLDTIPVQMEVEFEDNSIENED